MCWPPSHSDPEMNLAAGPPAEFREVRLRSDLEKVSAERQTEKQDAGTTCPVTLSLHSSTKVLTVGGTLWVVL